MKESSFMTKEKFREIRKEISYTQGQLADELKMDRKSIYNIENGKTPISYPVAELMNNLYNRRAKNIFLDVSNKEKLSLEEMVDFLLKHKSAFLSHEGIKLLFENHEKKIEVKLLEKYIFLKNLKNVQKD